MNKNTKNTKNVQWIAIVGANHQSRNGYVGTIKAGTAFNVKGIDQRKLVGRGNNRTAAIFSNGLTIKGTLRPEEGSWFTIPGNVIREVHIVTTIGRKNTTEVIVNRDFKAVETCCACGQSVCRNQ